MAEAVPEGNALLDSLGLAAFLEHDDRATLVFDAASEPPNPARLVYSNPAFRRFCENLPSNESSQLNKHLEPLLHWVPAATSPNIVHLGRTWTSFSVQERWRVVVGREEDAYSHTSSPTRSSDLEPPAAKRVKTSVARDHLRRDSSGEEGSHASFESNANMDWTQMELPGLTPFIQWIRNYDWARTPLGSMVFWSRELRLTLVTVMSNPNPRLVLWGPEHTLIYNEACVPIIGQKHPVAMGNSPIIAFPEVWDEIKPLVNAAMRDGKITHIHQMPLSLERSPGFSEETYFSFVLQPILGEDGKCAGVMDQFTEATSVVLAERRMRTVQSVGEKAAAADTLEGVWKGVLSALEANSEDIPFAMLYSVLNSTGNNQSPQGESDSPGLESPGHLRCALEGTVGFANEPQSLKEILNLVDEEKPFVQQFRMAWKLKQFMRLDVRDGTLPKDLIDGTSGRVDGTKCSQAVVCSIYSSTAANCHGFLVLGLNPRRPYDKDYQLFLQLLNDRVNHSAAAISMPKEYRLMQAAAEESALRHATLSRQLLLRTQEAEQREANFSRMASAAPVGCYLLRVDGTPIYLNDAYYEITGLDKPESLSFGADSAWRQQVVPEDIPKIEKAWYEIVNDKKPSLVEYRLHRQWRSFDNATGIDMCGPTWLLVTAFPELDDDGEVQTVIGWVSDISLQKWTEALQTERLTEALESKLQSERFIDLVSHEMRNPLSAILQSADSVLASMRELGLDDARTIGKTSSSESVMDSAVEGAKTIILCAQHQKRIVDDILTLSKLDSDLLVLCPEAVCPEEVTKQALKMYEAELHSSDITANIVVDESYDKLAVNTVLLDPSRFLQVLINLLTNAIKFTSGRACRRITLTLQASTTYPPSHSLVSYMPRRESRPEASLSQDWGDGPEVYLLFTIEDSGLGLSHDEMNSLFRRFSQATPRTHVQYGGSGLGLFISKELSELQGGQIGCSSTYGEGSTFAFYIRARRLVADVQREQELDQTPQRTHQSNPLSDAILLPASSSDGRGPEVPQIFPPAPKVRQFGSELTSPPTTPHQLLRRPEDLHVLIVEDNIINQKVMSVGLRRLGCTVHVANHGREAIEFLERSTFRNEKKWSSSDRQIDAFGTRATPTPLSLILLDVEMPVMDGLTCIKKIRAMERDGELKGHVPVAAVTANARIEQLNHALNHGMDLVITKPFRIPELVPKMFALVDGTYIAEKSGLSSYVESQG